VNRSLIRCSLVLSAAALGCVGTVDRRPSAAPTAPNGCRVTRTSGDVAVLRRSSDELVIAAGGVELLRSSDVGRSWRREDLPVRCRWPDVAEVGGRLLVSCAEPDPPGRLLVVSEGVGGGWNEPVTVAATPGIFIDTDLASMIDGSVLLVATEVDRPDDMEDAVYRVGVRRSTDGGTTWSAPTTAATEPRGVRLEDSRTVALDDGTVLLAVEREKVEGGRSTIVQLRSLDGGRTWSDGTVLWRGGDVEPGGYVRFEDGELWFIASSDERAGGGSYDRAEILARRSYDGGRSWAEPETLIDREDQLSFGGVALPDGDVLLPSVRHYSGPRRLLALYVVGRRPGTGARCAVAAVPSGR
jgi:hypothetical protein